VVCLDFCLRRKPHRNRLEESGSPTSLSTWCFKGSGQLAPVKFDRRIEALVAAATPHRLDECTITADSPGSGPTKPSTLLLDLVLESPLHGTTSGHGEAGGAGGIGPERKTSLKRWVSAALPPVPAIPMAVRSFGGRQALGFDHDPPNGWPVPSAAAYAAAELQLADAWCGRALELERHVAASACHSAPRQRSDRGSGRAPFPSLTWQSAATTLRLPRLEAAPCCMVWEFPLQHFDAIAGRRPAHHPAG